MQQFSLAIHDLRVSGAETTLATLKHIQDQFQLPLTVHLVCDAPLQRESALASFILKECQHSRIEIVFHGLSHKCPAETGKRTALYHKHQAEYLLDSPTLRESTRAYYEELSELLGKNIGICPPCWLASRENQLLFQELKPAYVESMLSLHNRHKQRWSPIISLGSPNPVELFWLRGLAHAMSYSALLTPEARVRVALHVCDLQETRSMEFFVRKVKWLLRRGICPVLQRNLLD